jgi:hypothetical protein
MVVKLLKVNYTCEGENMNEFLVYLNWIENLYMYGSVYDVELLK